MFIEGTYQIEMLQEMGRTKPAQGQKKQVLNFKAHQTCTGTKKQKSCTSKCTKPAQGQKKTFRGILAPSQVDWKVFVFLFFFCPCAGLVHFEVQNFCFFGPCAGLVHFEVQNLCFFCPCTGLVSFEVQNPMQLFISIVKP